MQCWGFVNDDLRLIVVWGENLCKNLQLQQKGSRFRN
jgi:hypothetical protein